MIGLEELNKRWEAAAARAIASEMSFDGEFLVLGAQTRLAKAGSALDEPRVVALLAAAHGRPMAAPALRHIQRALEKKRDGDVVLALVHLALSDLAKLREPKEISRRLFMADVFMSNGVDPLIVLKGLRFEPGSADEALERYTPGQPGFPPATPTAVDGRVEIGRARQAVRDRIGPSAIRWPTLRPHEDMRLERTRRRQRLSKRRRRLRRVA